MKRESYRFLAGMLAVLMTAMSLADIAMPVFAKDVEPSYNEAYEDASYNTTVSDNQEKEDTLLPKDESEEEDVFPVNSVSENCEPTGMMYLPSDIYAIGDEMPFAFRVIRENYTYTYDVYIDNILVLDDYDTYGIATKGNDEEIISTELQNKFIYEKYRTKNRMYVAYNTGIASGKKAVRVEARLDGRLMDYVEGNVSFHEDEMKTGYVETGYDDEGYYYEDFCVGTVYASTGNRFENTICLYANNNFNIEDIEDIYLKGDNGYTIGVDSYQSSYLNKDIRDGIFASEKLYSANIIKTRYKAVECSFVSRGMEAGHYKLVIKMDDDTKVDLDDAVIIGEKKVSDTILLGVSNLNINSSDYTYNGANQYDDGSYYDVYEYFDNFRTEEINGYYDDYLYIKVLGTSLTEDIIPEVRKADTGEVLKTEIVSALSVFSPPESPSYFYGIMGDSCIVFQLKKIDWPADTNYYIFSYTDKQGKSISGDTEVGIEGIPTRICSANYNSNENEVEITFFDKTVTNFTLHIFRDYHYNSDWDDYELIEEMATLSGRAVDGKAVVKPMKGGKEVNLSEYASKLGTNSYYFGGTYTFYLGSKSDDYMSCRGTLDVDYHIYNINESSNDYRYHDYSYAYMSVDREYTSTEEKYTSSLSEGSYNYGTQYAYLGDELGITYHNSVSKDEKLTVSLYKIGTYEARPQESSNTYSYLTTPQLITSKVMELVEIDGKDTYDYHAVLDIKAKVDLSGVYKIVLTGSSGTLDSYKTIFIDSTTQTGEVIGLYDNCGYLSLCVEMPELSAKKYSYELYDKEKNLIYKIDDAKAYPITVEDYNVGRDSKTNVIVLLTDKNHDELEDWETYIIRFVADGKEVLLKSQTSYYFVRDKFKLLTTYDKGIDRISGLKMDVGVDSVRVDFVRNGTVKPEKTITITSDKLQNFNKASITNKYSLTDYVSYYYFTQEDLAGLDLHRNYAVVLTQSDGKKKVSYGKIYDFETCVSFYQGKVDKQGTDRIYVKNGVKLPKIEVPERTGYTFDGYYTKVNGKGEKYYDENGESSVIFNKDHVTNVILIANWIHDKEDVVPEEPKVEEETKIYTITYNLFGGSNAEANPASYTDKDTAKIKLANPTYAGFKFEGWFIDSRYTKAITEIDPATKANIVLYAKWTPATYTVNFNANGGQGSMSAVTFGFGVDELLPACEFTYEGKYFEGWARSATEDIKAAVYSDGEIVNNIIDPTDATTPAVTLYAVWSSTESAVFYYGTEDATVVNGAYKDTYIPGTDVFKFPVLKKPGYTFDGWYTDISYETKISGVARTTKGRVDVYAKWSPYTYSIKFEANGGKGSMPVQTYDYEETVNIGDCMYERIGCTFTGWSLSKTGEALDAINTETLGLLKTDKNKQKVSLYAVWTPNVYNIEYITAVGDTSFLTPEDMTYTFGQGKLSLPQPSEAGYEFAGWYLDENYKSRVKSITSKIAEDVTLYAKWTRTYKIVFDPNGGDGEGKKAMKEQKMNYSAARPINLCRFTAPDDTMAFAGWAVSKADADNRIVTFVDNQIISDFDGSYINGDTMTLYAVWDQNFTISYELNGGTMLGAPVTSYKLGEGAGELPAAEKYGYKFVGWCSDKTLKKPVTRIGANDKGCKILYAKYEGESYNLAFDAGEAKGIAKGSMKNLALTVGDSKAISKNKFKAKGLTFAGWDINEDGKVELSNSQKLSGMGLYEYATEGRLTAVAIWKATPYKITYYTYNGNKEQGVYYTNEDTELLYPIRFGYEFDGWYYDKKYTKPVGDEIKAGKTGNLKLYAKWTKN